MEHHAESVIGDLAGLIADRALSTFRWGNVTRAEYEQVPLYWVGDLGSAAVAGAVPRTVAPPSPKQLERWLKDIGATLDATGGRGSHRKFKWEGKTGFYETSGDRLARKTATSLARLFDLSGPNELFRYIQHGLSP